MLKLASLCGYIELSGKQLSIIDTLRQRRDVDPAPAYQHQRDQEPPEYRPHHEPGRPLRLSQQYAGAGDRRRHEEHEGDLLGAKDDPGDPGPFAGRQEDQQRADQGEVFSRQEQNREDYAGDQD